MGKGYSWLIAIGFALIAVSIISDTVDQNKIRARLDKLEAQQATLKTAEGVTRSISDYNNVVSVYLINHLGLTLEDVFEADTFPPLPDMTANLLATRIDSIVYQDRLNILDLKNKIRDVEAKVERLDREIPKPTPTTISQIDDRVRHLIVRWGIADTVFWDSTVFIEALCIPSRVRFQVDWDSVLYVREHGGKP